LQARQKSLAEQTRFGTVTLRLEAPSEPVTAGAGGFTGGLKAGWEAFTTVLAGFAIALAATRTFPRAVRLGSGTDSLEAQTRLARSICRDHLLCLAAIGSLLAIQLGFAT
jgi:hypothetical protein